MKILISPAKNMVENNQPIKSTCLFASKVMILKKYLKQLNQDQIQELFKCNEKIAEENFDRFSSFDQQSLLNAIYSFNGLQYKNLNLEQLNEKSLKYLEENVLIFSGLYGLLRPFDGIELYRLDFKDKINLDNYIDGYSFWKEEINDYLKKEKLLNLASKEYSKILNSSLDVINIIFKEEINDKLVEKSTNVKIMRGKFLNYLANNLILDLEQIKKIALEGYEFDQDLSDENNFYYIKRPTN